MLSRPSRLIDSFPFDASVANALADEFAAQPPGRRWQAIRKALGRELSMLASGQWRHRARRIPSETTQLLWIYTWTTVGDAVLDLAPRTLLPASIEVDLLIAPQLAPLFAADPRFRRVASHVAECAARYDFVLLDSLRSSSLRLKARAFAEAKFATLREHQAGERFDRAAYADRRLRQLLGRPLEDADVIAPHLVLAGDEPSRPTDHTRIAVALGARVERKRYRHWPEVLSALVECWPAGRPAPRFELHGQGATARADADGFDREFVARHCELRVDAGNLADAARAIAACHAFIGIDGGLMHLAICVGTPGLAVFAGNEPRYFLRPKSPMRALAIDGALDELPPERVADAAMRLLPELLSSR